MDKKTSSALFFSAAAVFYSAFSLWLLRPYIAHLTGINRLFLICPVVSACGLFIISRRYVSSFGASLSAGAVYGFGSFACSFYCFHPFAFLVYAFLPFAFIPSVFGYKFFSKPAFMSALFSSLPFLFIAGSFFTAGRFFYFSAIPLQTPLTLRHLGGIVNPFYLNPDSLSPNFYHLPLAALFIGAVLFFRTRRYLTAFLLAGSLFLCFWKPLFYVPPVFWLSIAVLICSVIIASGFEAVCLSGAADGRWLLLAAAVLVFQAVFGVIMCGRSDRLLSLSGISVLAVLLIFFISRAGLGWIFLRKVILYSAAALDILIMTQNIIVLSF